MPLICMAMDTTSTRFSTPSTWPTACIPRIFPSYKEVILRVTEERGSQVRVRALIQEHSYGGFGKINKTALVQGVGVRWDRVNWGPLQLWPDQTAEHIIANILRVKISDTH